MRNPRANLFAMEIFNKGLELLRLKFGDPPTLTSTDPRHERFSNDESVDTVKPDTD
ncbi:MAG: hypothetical protein NVSMB27_48720 [Ktedonobacteraceae bacterium]